MQHSTIYDTKPQPKVACTIKDSLPIGHIPAHIHTIRTTVNGIKFRGLNEARMYVYLSEMFKDTATVIYEPESFELKPARDVPSRAYVPDFGVVFDSGEVLYIESKVCDSPDIQDAQIKLSALSKSGRPCLLFIGYPRKHFLQFWVNGLGTKLVEVTDTRDAANIASSAIDFYKSRAK